MYMHCSYPRQAHAVWCIAYRAHSNGFFLILVYVVCRHEESAVTDGMYTCSCMLVCTLSMSFGRDTPMWPRLLVNCAWLILRPPCCVHTCQWAMGTQDTHTCTCPLIVVHYARDCSCTCTCTVAQHMYMYMHICALQLSTTTLYNTTGVGLTSVCRSVLSRRMAMLRPWTVSGGRVGKCQGKKWR